MEGLVATSVVAAFLALLGLFVWLGIKGKAQLIVGLSIPMLALFFGTLVWVEWTVAADPSAYLAHMWSWLAALLLIVPPLISAITFFTTRRFRTQKWSAERE